MKLKVLVAEPSEILRIGLCTLFDAETNVAYVYEATTEEELRAQLRSTQFDFIVVNDVLITDMTILPYGQFIVLTSDFDMGTFQQACRCGARGYFLEKSSAELLQWALWVEKGNMLLEPRIASCLKDYTFSGLQVMIQKNLLSPSEREIVGLLHIGIDGYAMTKKGCVSEKTDKTYENSNGRKTRRKVPVNHRISHS